MEEHLSFTRGGLILSNYREETLWFEVYLPLVKLSVIDLITVMFDSGGQAIDRSGLAECLVYELMSGLYHWTLAQTESMLIGSSH